MAAVTWACAGSAFGYCFMLAAFGMTMSLAWLLLIFATGLLGSLGATRGAR